MKTWTGITAAIALLAGCSFPPPEDVPGDLLLLTLSVTGPGAVASADGFIATPTSTSHGYEAGAMVTLTASFDTTTTTLAWGGACSGSDPTCVVTMDQVQTVTAAFALFDRGLTVALAGVGGGKVESTTPGVVIDCGSTCAAPVPDGTVVTLVATPAAGDIFFGWSGGGCSGTGACTTTVTQATLVTATFDNCVRNSRQCTSDRLLVCGADGDFESYLVPNGGPDGDPVTVTYDGASQGALCPLGCHGSEPRCGDIAASTGVIDLLSDPAVSPTGIDLGQTQAVKIIDTATYNAATHTVSVTLGDDSTLMIPAALLPLSTGGDALALLCRSFTVPAGTVVTVRGARALVIVAHFDIVIAGTLDVSGSVRPNITDTRSCVGGSGVVSTGGGGFVASGGASNNGGAGGLAASQSFEFQTGCSGGDFLHPYGGQGGGAVQLVSRRRVMIPDGGLVNVAGAGGRVGCKDVQCQFYGAGGGGAGGMVIIEAPTVSIRSGAVVAGRGGNGAAMTYSAISFDVPADGMNGASGTTTGSANAGPATSLSGGVGGIGGTEASGMNGGTAGTGSGMARAGGGGSVGRAIIRNANGLLQLPAGAMKLVVSSGALPAPL